ncbi:MAG: Imidazole glycerol phosphate synthase subunit HisH [Chloroflexi bacterium]|nr:Imidazole glycerol phosphate synthase subunit HisH [Chloroflexota bacterium]
MITIIDYKAGNLTSVRRALGHLGLAAQITPDPEVVRRAERIIFPGVGHAGAAMRVLQERGLDDALRAAFARGVPILGICIGAQIILSHSEEGDTPCLDLLPGTCPRFTLDDPRLTVPHMGWNAVDVRQPHAVLQDLQPGDEFYFVHSYYPQPEQADDVYATATYEREFPAAVGRDNLFAVQFHTEKSGRIGLTLLKNFASWTP